MWKYELEYRIDRPETESETDKHFDLDNYKDWLEEQLTDCRKQLSIQNARNCEQLNTHKVRVRDFIVGDAVCTQDGMIWIIKEINGNDLLVVGNGRENYPLE